MVSLVIPCFNNVALTKQCVGSVLRNTDPDRTPYQIIAIDNGSTDGTAEYLAETAAVLVRNGDNLGYVRAVNQGLCAAAETDVVVLNNDTIVTPQWLERLLAHLKREENVGIVGPRSNAVAGVQRLVDAPTTAHVAEIEAYAQRLAEQHPGTCTNVPRVIGFCMLVARPVIEKIGGLDPLFGMGNFDDDDYCLRARLAGFAVVVANDVYVHHVGSSTFRNFSPSFYDYVIQENWKKFAKKWHLPVNHLTRGYTVDLQKLLPFDPARHAIPFCETSLE